MERKIGEVFKFEERWLKVKEEDINDRCKGCYLTANCNKFRSFLGECEDEQRSDNKGVIFEDITYKLEEQQEEFKTLPKTWEEFCKNYPIKEVEYFLNTFCELHGAGSGNKRQKKSDRNILPSLQAAEAHLALMQLHQLRDVWREGWLPNWNDKFEDKYVIVNRIGIYTVVTYQYIASFLAFQDEKRAKKFLECFKDLIEQAGDLI